MRAIRRQELPAKPETESSDKELLWKICQACWAYDPNKRIRAEEVVQQIDPGECMVGRASYLQHLMNILSRTKDWFFRGMIGYLPSFRFFGYRG